jgi:hypothetical protein
VKNQTATVATATIDEVDASLVVLSNSLWKCCERHCSELVGGIHLDAVVAIIYN